MRHWIPRVLVNEALDTRVLVDQDSYYSLAAVSTVYY